MPEGVESHVCVSTRVRVVQEFQAAFHTTFSHRLTCMLDSTSKGVPPTARIEVKVSKRAFSLVLSASGLEKSPIWVCSDLVCLITPGEVCKEPTQVW